MNVKLLKQELAKRGLPTLLRPQAPDSVLLSVCGQLGKKAGKRAACVKREWRDVVWTAKALGMYRTKVLSVAVGGGGDSVFTVFCLSSCASGRKRVYDDSEDEDGHDGEEMDMPALGHDGEGGEGTPTIIEALVGKKVIGTAAWTDSGQLFTFGTGDHWRLGHEGTQDELVPMLVKALVRKKVIGAAPGAKHTVAWTDSGELFTLSCGMFGKLGHGGHQNELLPRLMGALAEKEGGRCGSKSISHSRVDRCGGAVLSVPTASWGVHGV